MQNMHKIERFSRALTGLFVMSLCFWGPKNPAFLMGFVAVVTGWTGVCPLYKKIGLSTISGKLERVRLFSKRCD
jgi:hypothetical protein